MSDESKFESEEWEMFFLEEPFIKTSLREKDVFDIRFRIKGRRESGDSRLTDKELEDFKQDLKDLGKWRRYKKFKKDLENG